MPKQDFLKLIEDIFSKDGALVAAGGRHNPQQQEYATVIAKGLIDSESVVMAEATTGIGKSIGYLIPALAYLSLYPESKPIVVSTHTRNLQRQLVEKDVVLASQTLEAANLSLPKIAFRMGRPAFFSPLRVEDAVKNLDKGRAKAAHHDLVKYANASAVSGTGLWMDYIDDYGSFPDGISAEDVCLLDVMTIDNPAYERHLAKAKDAQLIITNHATIMSRFVFKGSTFHAIIADEAHEIEDVCINLATYKSQLKRIATAVQKTNAMDDLTKKTINLAFQIENSLNEFDLANNYKATLVSDVDNPLFINQLQPKIVSLKKMVQQCRNNYHKGLSSAPTHKEATVLDRIDRHLDTLSAFETGNMLSKRRAIAFSPKQRDTSVASISLNAGWLFNYQMQKLTSRLILVSATMSNASNKKLSFSMISRSLGIKEDRITNMCSISPSNFGKMSFVVVPNGQSPLIKNDQLGEQFDFDMSWIKNTCRMIEKAAEKGKTLVLSPSIRESKLLAKHLKVDYLLQDETTPLMQLSKTFITSDTKVLLSAGAWTGVSLRDTDNQQLLKNVIITRIPFIPLDADQQHIQREYLLNKGFSESKIKAIQWTQIQYRTLIKLKQGIGRGLRAPDDEVTIWLADPRMPTAKRPTGLLSAIPERFMANYYEAMVFSKEADVKKSKPLFYL